VSIATPKIIGIVGFPTHGKSTAQRFLIELGVEPRDDGDILREAVAEQFNLSWEDVTTQAGKAKIVPGIDGEPTTIRKLLGDYGKVLEARHGEFFTPNAALSKLLAERARDKSTQTASFGSVRMSQTSVYKAAGGFIIEILDPRKPVGPLFEFDEFDRDDVDVIVINDGSEADLALRVLLAVSDYLELAGTETMFSYARRFF
jgi:hypothetical protein